MRLLLAHTFLVVGTESDKPQPRRVPDAPYACAADGTWPPVLRLQRTASPPAASQGIYLLSTLVQLRTSFPPPFARPDTEPDVGVVNLFSTLPEYQVFGSVFDGSFLLTAAASAVVRWFNARINSVGVVDTS